MCWDGILKTIREVIGFTQYLVKVLEYIGSTSSASFRMTAFTVSARQARCKTFTKTTRLRYPLCHLLSTYSQRLLSHPLTKLRAQLRKAKRHIPRASPLQKDTLSCLRRAAVGVCAVDRLGTHALCAFCIWRGHCCRTFHMAGCTLQLYLFIPRSSLILHSSVHICSKCYPTQTNVSSHTLAPPQLPLATHNFVPRM